jgi:hypothetical protein
MEEAALNNSAVLDSSMVDEEDPPAGLFWVEIGDVVSLLLLSDEESLVSSSEEDGVEF